MRAIALGAPWHHLPRCESTNDELVRLGRSGAVAGTVVTTDVQTRGRGRQGRSWHSPADENLYLSVLLRPALLPHRAPMLCLAAGLALYDAVSQALTDQGQRDAVDLRLKWPNDLLARPPQGASRDLPYRKLGGILTELIGSGGQIDFVVIGVGCNTHSRDFPPGVPGTSLRMLLTEAQPAEGARVPGPRPVAELFLRALSGWYERYLSDGAAAITVPFAQAAKLGPHHPPVHVSLGRHDAPLTGIPVGLGADGELLLSTESGLQRVLSGDVEMTQPAGV